MYTLNKLCMTCILMLYQIMLQFTLPVISQPSFTSRVCQDQFGNYTANSTFKKNLDTLFSTILSDTKIDYGFYNFSVGQNMDVVHGIGLCRTDISVADCKTCLTNAAGGLVAECPNQKDAIGWYETCMLRYSDRYIFRKMELGPWFHMQSDSHFGDKERFNETAATLLARLQKEAASGDSRRKFAAGQANVTGSSTTISAFAQCTPDLEYADCYYCLEEAINFPLTSNLGENARVSFTSCQIRFENYPFYNSSNLMSSVKQSQSPQTSSSSQSPSSTVKRKGIKSKKLRIIIIVVPLVATCLLLLVCLFGCYFYRTKKAQKSFQAGDEMIRNPESLKMDFSTIKTATGNFSDANKLGQGGFGTVYKGGLPNGHEVAVKRLSRNAGAQGGEEFKNEAVLVARLRHRNLVTFLGYCLEGEERLLIYELLPNKSLDFFLFDTSKRVLLDWQTRYKIIGGIARGLLYLHEESQLLVVHRDLKAGNILLDAELNPKITDFGMARLFGVDQTHEDTRKICGTFGYMPPEYVQQGHFSVKSDVYGFGVLLLEIISGLRVTSYYNEETGEGLLAYVWRNWLEGTPLNIVDSSIMANVATPEVLIRCINIGLLCVQENIAHRPIMSTVVLMLNSHNDVSPTLPSRPAFLLHNNVDSDDSDQLNVPSINKVSLSEIYPR